MLYPVAPLIVISPFSPDCLVAEPMATGVVGAGGCMDAATSGATPGADIAFYFPFVLYQSTTFIRAAWFNGATANGNVDIGVYGIDGTRLWSLGSTAQSGTNAIQINTVNFTVGPGLFYLAIALSSATGTLFRVAVSAAPTGGGRLTQASAFPLPATATFETGADVNAFVPVCGIATRAI
jgi:hypothetical protein